jgi:hypothetical protein
MKTYTGYRRPEGCVVKIHQDDSTSRDLPLRLDLRNHSPTGPEWGFAGSGGVHLEWQSREWQADARRLRHPPIPPTTRPC